VSDTSLVFNAVGRDRGVNSLLSKTAGNVRAANVASATSLVALGGAMASAGAYAVALGSSAMTAAGAIALMPAAVAAAAAAVGAAKATTFGLADAWKATGVQAKSGGGASVNTAKAVAAAQREVRQATQALADAQRTALDAQLAVTRARQDEVERLDDLGRAAAGAALDEETAVNRVADAQRDLNTARRSGKPQDIRDADLAYRQAEQTLLDVRDRVEDLGREQVDAARSGVEGSDAVQQALRAQADAQRGVSDSAERLALAEAAVGEAAQKAAAGGINPAAEALAKLSPNGRAVILTLRDLAGAWQGAARFGQQRTFAGVSGDLRGLSSTYLPMTTTWLGRMGGSFNTAIRQSMGLAQTKSTIKDVGSVLNNTALSTDKLARAIKPVVNGILQFVAVGSAFLPGLSGDVGSLATKFERWAIASRESGQMQEWIGKGVAVLKDFAAIAGNVVMSVVGIFKAGSDNGGTVDGLVKGSAAMRAWIESTQGQEKIKEIFTTLRSIFSGLADIIPVVTAHSKDFEAGMNITGQTVQFVAGHLDTISRWLPVIAAGFVAVKIAEIAGNVARVASLPILAAQTASNWGLKTAMNAHTTALRANTVATTTGSTATKAGTVATVASDVATKRSVVSMAAAKVAAIAGAAATWIATAATTAFGIAVTIATSPITLIVLALAVLAFGIWYLATKTTFFQTIWKATWGFIKDYFWLIVDTIKTIATTWWNAFSGFWTAIGTFFKNLFFGIKDAIVGAWNWAIAKGVDFYNWIVGLGGKLRAGLGNVAGIISAPFKSAFNAIASLWNRTVGRLSFTAPSWVPGIGGKGFSMPQLPMLAKGGVATAAGLAIVGEAGPEIVNLNAGASVTPLPKGGGSASGGRRELRVIVVGGDRESVEYFRRLQAQYGF
jgi:hypothetical protein